MLDAASSSRRLLLLCVVTTLGLGWLAWQVVKDDRYLNPSPVRNRRERAAEAAMNALVRLLTQTESRLGSVDTKLQDLWAIGHVDGLSLVVMRRRLVSVAGAPVTSYSGARPLYYPVKFPNVYDLELASPTGYVDLLDRADIKELRERDLIGALGILDSMLDDSRRRVRANALLRIARIQRKLGNVEKALDAYATLSTLKDTNVSGLLPATLAAAKGRALIFVESGRDAELQREASEIYDGLVNRRWMLWRGDFQQAYRQAMTWLAGRRPAIDAEQLAIAEALAEVWRDGSPEERPTAPGITRVLKTVRVDDVPVVTMSEWSPGGLRAFFLAPRYLQQAWRKDLVAMPQHDGIDFVLTDAGNLPILGTLAGSPSRRSVRSGAAMQLPWNVYAISADDDSLLNLSVQAKVMLSGIAIMGVFVVGAAYVINKATRRELRAAQMQSEFVAAVSHEFRTPLTTLRQLTEMLVKGRISSEERRQLFYDTLLRESERMQRLVEGLLNFGSMEAGELQYRFTVIDLEPFIRDIVADFERSIEGRGYAVEVVSTLEPTLVRADRDLLARVFWNLLDNAVKYSPDERTIRVELTSADGRAAVSVRDRGAGIAPAEQKTIFDKFVRGRAARATGVQGTGVGLAMVRRIVTAHDGEISLASQPGHGSVFTVLLPIARP